MLMSRPRAASTHAEVANIHNYYERLVTESITKTDDRALEDTDFLADVSCVALNHLPPRYIRHDVDMSFFMSPVEREETEEKVQTAVDYALIFVRQREEERQEFTPEDIITDAVNSEDDVEQAIAEESSQPIEQEEAAQEATLAPETELESAKPGSEESNEDAMVETDTAPAQSPDADLSLMDSDHTSGSVETPEHNADASADNTDMTEATESPMPVEDNEQDEAAPTDFSMDDMPMDDAGTDMMDEMPELTQPSAQAEVLPTIETNPPQ
ncbi:late competence development ComFB family protein [Eionea flava]